MGVSGILIMAILLPTQAHTIMEGIFSRTKDLSPLSMLFSTSPVAKVVQQTDFSPIETIQTTTKGISDIVTTATTKKTTTQTITAEGIIDATNDARIAAGLSPFLMNQKLAASAKIKTEDMIQKGYFEHVSPTGVSVSDLGVQVGYNYIIMGENLALGNFSSVDDIVTAWMNSPGHRANILNTSYMEIGVYAAEGTYKGRKVWFAVQHFGTARGVCPAINDTLKKDIDTFNSSLKSKEKSITTMRAELDLMMSKNTPEYAAKVTAFNTLVNVYNAELATSQQTISRYNKQVVAFNDCLSKYQQKAR